MDLDCARKQLRLLTTNAVSIVRAGFGLNEAEPVFFAIVDLVRDHPGLRPDVVADVALVFGKREPGLVGDGLFPPDLVELLAHEFAWPEFAALCDKRIAELLYADPSFAGGDLAGSVREALEPDWQDRDFYRRYGGGRPPTAASR
jgi:hypothetical protein